MSGRVGSITTGIITNGLVLNMDVGNLASFSQNNKIINTADISISGSFQGAPTFNDTSLSFKYLRFDGIDDWIRIKDSDFPSNRTAFTIEIIYSPWANHTNFKNPGIAKWQTGANSNNEWFLGCRDASGPSPFFFNVFGTSSNIIDTSAAGLNYTAGNWYYQVGTFDGNNNGLQKLYVNGVLYASNETGLSACKTYSPQDVSISNFGTSYQYEAKQNVGRIAYYNRALSDNEILHNYNALKSRFGL